MHSLFKFSVDRCDRLDPPRRLTTLALFLAASIGALLLPRGALAGPNLGGTLLVHDTGFAYSTDAFTYPTVAPANCAAIDAEVPTGPPADGIAWVWKIYAAFPEGAHPRLKALAFGANYDPEQVHIVAGGVPDPYWDFQVPDDYWLSLPETGVGVSLYAARTELLSEVYWIAGYAYSAALWSTTPHPRHGAVFVDDSTPPAEDAIAGFSSIGLGMSGVSVCPAVQGACCLSAGACVVRSSADCDALGGLSWGPYITCEPYPCTTAPGACCLPDGTCRIAAALECARSGGIPGSAWTTCTAYPCPPPIGACCFASGYCAIRDLEACAIQDGVFRGPQTVCTPNPCPQPIHGGCCLASGQCVILSPEQCAQIAGVYLGNDTVCIPNPCPQPDSPGACCFADGTCLLRTEEVCAGVAGVFQGVGSDCAPNPCAQPDGACCLPDGLCELLTSVACRSAGGTWFGPGTVCQAALCDSIPGACCLADGSCQLLPVTECSGIFLPGAACDANPCLTALGACCFLDGSCLMLLESHCLANGGFYWWRSTSCAPNPCDATVRLKRMNWGKIKLEFLR